MTYFVKTLYLNNFRSYKDARVEFGQPITILHGSNAAGKTNIIEALQLLTTGKSFRRPGNEDLVSYNSEKASISICATDGALKRDVSLNIENKERQFTINGKRVRSQHEIVTVLPCVIFTPDDLMIIKDSSKRRRSEIDYLGIQLSSTYSRLVTEYKKIIIQRNKLLREGQFNEEVFNAWTERMIQVGLALGEKRKSLLKCVEAPMMNFYQGLLCPNSRDKQKLTIEYKSTWGNEGDENLIRERVKLVFMDEKIRKVSLLGPHRDDLIFKIDGRDARNFASQGQQRSVALAWKMAQLDTIEQFTQAKPLLLLDDVMSELDQVRRSFLVNAINKVAQTVITTVNLDYFNDLFLREAKVIEVPNDIEK